MPASSKPQVPLVERMVPEEWLATYLIALAMAALLLVAAWAGADTARSPTAAARLPGAASGPTTAPGPATPAPRPPGRSAPGLQAPVPSTPGPVTTTPAPSTPDPSAGLQDPTRLPGGAPEVFANRRLLVAYYGTAGTASLGVLGEAGPDEIMPRLTRAARDFAVGGRQVQPVFELIVTVAHAGPTKSGSYSSDIDRSSVQRYIDAAHRHGVLLVLDLQPGRADFLTVAKRWAWALEDPWVGLALDPEWRMSLGGVPGQRIGSVSADEVNRTSQWLDDLTAAGGLPQKVFLLHQFRLDMIRRLDLVSPRPHLAVVQQVDGYGSPRAKLDTFHTVARPGRFTLGFKLFYDEDVPRMGPAQVLRIRPEVSFVSYQ